MSPNMQKLIDARAKKTVGGVATNFVDVPSRQQQRAADRRDAFAQMTHNFGGELRSTRRAMAFASVRNRTFFREIAQA